MSYRFIRITDYYEEFLDSYYNNNLNCSHLSYNEEYLGIIEQSIEIVSSYGKYLRKIGVDAIDVISNATSLQKKWAIEHNFSSKLSNDEIVFEQIKYYQPEIVWIDSTRFLSKEWITYLRENVKSLKLVVGHICAPYNATIEAAFHELDIVFTCSPCTVDNLKRKGVKNIELAYHAFNHSVLNEINTEINDFPQRKLVFTGSLITGYGLHNERIEYLERIINSDIDITIFGNLESTKRIFFKN